MPVALPSPNVSRLSSLPSLSVSRSATTPPPPPRPPCVDTNTSPFGATTRCRARPTSAATTAAQKPCGSVRPPLSASHIGADAPRTAPAATRHDSVNRVETIRFIGLISSQGIATKTHRHEVSLVQEYLRAFVPSWLTRSL